MATPTFQRRELASAEVCFIPSGETVDAVTVAAETWPDEDPTTNFTDYALPDIESIVAEKGIETESFRVPDPNGGYTDDEEQMITSRKWVITTAKTNNFIKQLDHGLANPVADATAQAHGAVTDNYLLGVLRVTEKDKTGAVIQTTKVWAKMRVRSAGDVGPATKKLEVEFKQEFSSLNTFTAAA